MKSAFLHWSSGKDAAMTLHKLQINNEYQVVELVTTLNSYYDRVTMHGLRRELLSRQLEELGISFSLLDVPKNPDMEVYNMKMQDLYRWMKSQGVLNAAYGDIFLEDLRQYRDNQLSSAGLKGVYPLWKMDTNDLICEFLDLGFRAVVVCVDGSKLDRSFAGVEIDRYFLKNLPKGVDPCGENGEFHTFCFDGPIFREPVSWQLGELTERTYPSPRKTGEQVSFWFADLL